MLLNFNSTFLYEVQKENVMKITIIILITGCFLYGDYVDSETKLCGIPESASNTIDLNQEGGIYITAQGELKVLVVFAKFSDDNIQDSDWPLGQPPVGWDQFIDGSTSDNSTNYANITHYFNEMSMGLFNVIGEAVYLDFPYPSTDYTGGNGRARANRDALIEIDSQVDFSSYDNWTRIDDYDHDPTPDGIVDMIIMIWRGNYFSSLWSGEASLGHSVNQIQLDSVNINFGYPAPPWNSEGSGVTVQFHYNQSVSRVLKTTVHEMGHWLIGKNHPYSNNYQKYAIWGILGMSFHSGQCANTFERHQLGWINAIEATDVTAPLPDYITTGIAYRYHPPNGFTDEYYYIENHQFESIYDDVSKEANDKGIYILHSQGAYDGSNNIKTITSEGFYDFYNPVWVENIWDPNAVDIPAYKKVSENRNGLSVRERLPFTNPPPGVSGNDAWMHVLYNGSNNYLYGAFFKGEHSNTSFNPITSTVFSPWSNPPATIWGSSGSSAEFSMEIMNVSNGVVSIQFFINNPEESKPSNPMNYRSSVNNYHPQLQWSPNIEPDLQGYILYKLLEIQESDTETFSFFLGPNVTSFTDQDFDIKKRRLNLDRATYWLVAIDDQGLESDPTEEKSFTGMSRIQWKQTVNMDVDPLLFYPLNQGNVWTYTMINTYTPYRSVERVVRDSIATEGRHVWTNEKTYYNSGHISNHDHYYFIDTLYNIFSTWINPSSFNLSANLNDTTIIYYDTTHTYPSTAIVEAVDTVLVYGDSTITKAYSLSYGTPPDDLYTFYYLNLAYGLGPYYQTGETMGEKWLTGAFIDGVLFGDTTLLSIDGSFQVIPNSFALLPPYPNPFNPITTIKIDIPERSHIELIVFDLSGRVVTELVNKNINAGTYNTVWNGKDSNGRQVSSGVYIYTLTAKSQETGKMFTQSNKMVLLK